MSKPDCFYGRDPFVDIMDKIDIIADTVSDAFKELDRIFDILFGIQIKAPGRSKRCCIRCRAVASSAVSAALASYDLQPHFFIHKYIFAEFFQISSVSMSVNGNTRSDLPSKQLI